MNLLRAIMQPQERAAWPSLYGIDDIPSLLRGTLLAPFTPSLSQPREEVPGDYLSLIAAGYQRNPVIFGAVQTRALLFSQATFQWQNLGTAATFGNADLVPVERPEPLVTTSEMLHRVILDADHAGTWFAVRTAPDRIKRLRPDWCWLITGDRTGTVIDPRDPRSEVIGLAYRPGGYASSEPVETFDVGQFAMWWWSPSPVFAHLGQPWVWAVIPELQADNASTVHKLRFFENGATPSLLVKFPPTLPKDKAAEFIEMFEQQHSGAMNAYKTAYLGGGAEAAVVGANLQQLDFRAVQGLSETRIAVASGIHAVVLGISEGLQGSSLNAGNFAQARRWTIDHFLWPAWTRIAHALEGLLTVPGGSRLWFDPDAVPFLSEDVQDQATILQTRANAIRTLTDGGYDPAAVIDAVVSGDLAKLVHMGLPSVQLQPAGSQQPATPAASASLVDVHCTSCGRLAGRFSGGYEVKCSKCGQMVLDAMA